MSDERYFDPYDADRPLLMRCSCGRHTTSAEHDAAVRSADAAAELRRRSETTDFESYSNAFIEATLVKALFPQDALRRRFLRAVGRGTRDGGHRAACCRSRRCRRWRRRRPARSRRTNLKIGFIPITCATPLIMAHPLGFYSKQGLNVEVVKTAGWALIRDKMLNKEYDATHFLSPMPLAISLGVGLERRCR